MDRLNAWNRLPDGGRLLVENPQAADLDVPLTNSIIPQRGMGAVTYSRATIATVIDNDWIIRNCLSGEARFQGARRVANLATFSEDAGNASWTKSRSTVTTNSVVDPDGKLVADTLVWDGTGPSYFYKWFSFVSGNKYRASICFKAANVSTVSITSFTQTGTCSFDLAGGTAGTPTGIASAPSIQSLWNGWYRCSVLFTANATGTNNVWFVNVNYLGDICYVVRMQMEDVTGQSIQTVGEYVSTSVLTTAPFHGSNVDGVKCFKTTLDWLPISPSILKGILMEPNRTNRFVRSEDFGTTWAIIWSTRSVNSAVAPSGELTADKLIPNNGVQQSNIVQTVTTTASQYSFSVYVKSSGLQFIQLNAQATISNWYVNFDIVNWTVWTSGVWTGYIENVGNGWFRCTATTESAVWVATQTFNIYCVDSNSASRWATCTGDGVNWVYLWGAQLEVWATATSYILTVWSIVTRNVDTLNYDVGNILDVKWAVYCEASVNLQSLTINDIASKFLVDRWASWRYFYLWGGSLTSINNYDWTNILTSNIGTSMNGNTVKVATAWDWSTKYIYYWSTASKSWSYVGTFWSGNINIWTSWNGTIRNVKVWKTPPTVAELTSITTL